jgi:hypothetical protein
LIWMVLIRDRCGFWVFSVLRWPSEDFFPWVRCFLSLTKGFCFGEGIFPSLKRFSLGEGIFFLFVGGFALGEGIFLLLKGFSLGEGTFPLGVFPSSLSAEGRGGGRGRGPPSPFSGPLIGLSNTDSFQKKRGIPLSRAIRPFLNLAWRPGCAVAILAWRVHRLSSCSRPGR